MAQHAQTAVVPPAAREENPARELLSILARGKWTVLLVFLIVTGAVVWGTMRALPVYEAEASLLVRIGREYVYRSEVGRTETARMPSLSEMVNSEVEILSSRDLAEQVVREIGVERMYPRLLETEPDPHVAAEKAVLLFRKAATIRPVLESSVIKVSFEHEVPELAAEAVNLLVERFKDKHIEVFGEERAKKLEVELAARLESMNRVERALSEFKREKGVFDLAQQRSLLLSRRERLDAALQACEAELVEVRLRAGPDGATEDLDATPELPPHLFVEMKPELLRHRHELERELRGIEPPVSDRVIEQASLRLLDLEIEEGKLLRDFTPENRQVLSVQNEIRDVRLFLEEAERRAGAFDQARQKERLINTEELQNEIARLTAEIELLVREEDRQARLEASRLVQVLESQRKDHQARLAAVELDIRNLDEQEQPLRKLERDLTIAEAAVQIYQQRVEEARLSEELDREKHISVKPIEKAATPVAPSGLPPKLKLAIGAFVGLVAGVGVAVLLDLFRVR